VPLGGTKPTESVRSDVYTTTLLERAVSYKEKKDRGLTPNAGLFTYPALMAVDILAYDSDIVPVGPHFAGHRPNILRFSDRSRI
tara:strand:- start:464 stop:715 length:252 start_codon:yes stop_codon:yes gene_type:complete